MALVNPELIAPKTSYERRRPEKTLLYKLVQENLLSFCQQLEHEHGSGLPDFVKKEFDEFLKCGILAHGFLRAKCESCRHEKLVAFSCKRRGFCPSCGARRMAESAAHLVDEVLPHKPLRQWVLSLPFQLRYLLAAHPKVMGEVLQIFHRALNTYQCKKAGLKQSTGSRTGAITFIQRFGGSLNLNIHFHTLCLDGAYSFTDGQAQFHFNQAPSQEELEKLLKQIATRVVKHLEKRGLIQKDEEDNFYLPCTENAFDHIQASSITYRIALGKNKGQKALTLKTVATKEEKQKPFLAKYSGFSLHAGVACKASERKKLERVCRYISRPSLSEERLSLSANGQVVYKLKNAFDNGTTHIVLEPLDLLARLASLVPRPRVNLTRFFGVFAPHFKHRKLVVPKPETKEEEKREPLSPAAQSKRMTWAQRLKRVFNIDITTCPECAGKVRVIASIEEPQVIKKILNHLGLESRAPTPWPPRGPPPSAATAIHDLYTQSFPNEEF